MDAETIQTGLRALHDRVIVAVPKPKETLSRGGIILPPPDADGEANTDKSIEGVVVAVGPGIWLSRGKKKWFRKTVARVGQRVVFAQYSGETLRVARGADNETTYFVLHDDEIVATIDGDGEVTALGDALAEAAAQ